MVCNMCASVQVGMGFAWGKLGLTSVWAYVGVKSNVTELTIGDTTIMFSYQTPVAGYDDHGAFRTDRKYSVTTSRQINQYLGGKEVGRTVSQEYINSLVEVA
jgi:hypothetical protein